MFSKCSKFSSSHVSSLAAKAAIGPMVIGALAAGSLASSSATASAATIGYNMSALPGSTSSSPGFDITDGGSALDWYALAGQASSGHYGSGYSSSAYAVWDSTPTGGTESLSAANGFIWAGSGIYYQYSGGKNTRGSTGLSATGVQAQQYSSTPSNSTFTQTIETSSETAETLTMPVKDFLGVSTNTTGLTLWATLTDSNSNTVATLGSPSSPIAVPTSDMVYVNATAYDGLLTINLAGAAVGDMLTVGIANQGTTANGGANGGPFSVTVTSDVPEPIPLGLMTAAGVGLLLLGKRRRA